MSAATATARLPPLEGVQRTLGTLALSLASFMNILDTTITNVSITAISGDLGASPSQGTWIITSYTAANAITVLLSGWLVQRVGQVRLIVASVLLFAFSSLCCALSPTLEALVFFRILQGLVSGPMVAMGQPLLIQSYPADKMGSAMGAWMMTLLVAPVLGPPLGGYLTDNMTWHWIFYINIPVGCFAGWAIWQIYRHRESATRKTPIDFVGLALMVMWVTSLQVVADKGRELDWFNSDLIVTLAVIAAVGFCFFLAWELTDRHPVVDLHLFRYRNFSIATTLIAVSYAIFFGSNVITPLWLQQYMGYNALTAGMMLAPMALIGVIFMPLIGKLSNRRDTRWVISLAFLAIFIAFHQRSGMTSHADFVTIVVPLIMMGGGLAFFFVPLSVIAMSGLPPERMASASGVLNFMRYFLAALSASLTTTLWDERLIVHHSQLAETINPGTSSGFQESIAAAGLSATQGLALIEQQITMEAAVLGANDVYFVTSIIMLSVSCIVWFTRPARRTTAAPIDPGH